MGLDVHSRIQTALAIISQIQNHPGNEDCIERKDDSNDDETGEPITEEDEDTINVLDVLREGLNGINANVSTVLSERLADSDVYRTNLIHFVVSLAYPISDLDKIFSYYEGVIKAVANGDYFSDIDEALNLILENPASQDTIVDEEDDLTPDLEDDEEPVAEDEDEGDNTKKCTPFWNRIAYAQGVISSKSGSISTAKSILDSMIDLTEEMVGDYTAVAIMLNQPNVYSTTKNLETIIAVYNSDLILSLNAADYGKANGTTQKEIMNHALTYINNIRGYSGRFYAIQSQVFSLVSGLST